MPGLHMEWHILPQASISGNQQMGRYPQLTDACKVRMGIRIETIAEQLIDTAGTKFTRRQGYIVNDQKINLGPGRPFAAVR